MNVTLDLYKLLRNAYLCDLDTDNVQYKRLLEHSIHSISFNTQLMLNQSNSDILYVESSEEDSQILVKNGVYEGGFAIWESNWHFLKFLQSHLASNSTKGKVLDLGCGCGFVGLLAFLKGYEVCFQDMNQEVLERSVLSNFILNYWFTCIKESNDLTNFSPEKLVNLDPITLVNIIGSDLNDSILTTDVLLDKMIKSKWFGNLCDKGPQNCISLTCSTWDKLIRNPKNGLVFDYILSSETLYRTQEYSNIVDILEKYLSATGIAYFATKRFYFGIGGGSFEFIDHVQNRPNTLKAGITESINNKHSCNVIDIIKVYKHNNSQLN